MDCHAGFVNTYKGLTWVKFPKTNGPEGPSGTARIGSESEASSLSPAGRRVTRESLSSAELASSRRHLHAEDQAGFAQD
jgi:hypothetical protein